MVFVVKSSDQGGQEDDPATGVGYITYVYDPWDSLLKTINSTDGTVIESTYDGRGRLISMSDPDRGFSEYQYDPAGALIWHMDAKMQVRKYVYDDMGRLTNRKEIVDEGAMPAITYESVYEYNNVKGQNGFTLPKSHRQGSVLTGPKVEYEYDELGRLVKEETTLPQYGDFPAPGGASGKYTVDRSYNSLNGQLDTLTYPLTFEGATRLKLKYGYTNGILTTVTNHNDSTEVFYTLNEMDVWGNAKKTDMGNGVTTTRTFNTANPWLDSISSTGTAGTVQNMTFGWDNVGNLTSRQNVDKSLSETFTYDERYRLKTAAVAGCSHHSCAMSVTYTANGNIATKSSIKDDQTGTYDYDGTTGGGPHAVSAIKNVGSTLATFTYDANGNMTQRDYAGSSGSNTISWTTFDKPAQIQAGDSTTDLFYDANYQRFRQVESVLATVVDDGEGVPTNVNKTAETLYVSGIFERHVSQLDVDGGVPIIGFRQYIMANGERIATLSDVQSTGSGDGDSFPDHNDNCSLVANNDQRDTDGDGFGNACDPDLNNDGVVNFLDLSLFSQVFLTDDPDADFNGDGVVNFLDLSILSTYFLLGPGPAWNTELGESIQYFHTDHLGSIESMTDINGVLIGEFSYDAFGRQRDANTWSSQEYTAPEGPEWAATTRGYTDHEQLRGVGLIHMNGRVYDPLIGRVISADPFVPDPTATQSFNRYSYVRNNPLSSTDPSGFFDRDSGDGFESQFWSWDPPGRLGFPAIGSSGYPTGNGAGDWGSVAPSEAGETGGVTEPVDSSNSSNRSGSTGANLRTGSASLFHNRQNDTHNMSDPPGPFNRLVRIRTARGLVPGLDYQLVYDGDSITFVNQDGSLGWSFDGVSGAAGFQDPRNVGVANRGPLPPGLYRVSRSEIQSRPTDFWTELKGFFGRGTWPGGNWSWGNNRIWLRPLPGTNTLGRDNFSIHGGSVPGSAGCIDLCGGMQMFMYRFRSEDIDMTLLVKYPKGE